MREDILKEARQFLHSPDLTERIIRDMSFLGYVGEEQNKLLGYLISVSRKLQTPLSGIVLSSPSSGKSRMVDTIELLTPQEDVIFTSRLTPQALYYMPKDFLKHKLLIIEERCGSELADYSIRTLQSKGSLTLAIPIKNQTTFFKVAGPLSVLETTTSLKLNLENTSRCFILHLDESVDQTRLIHAFQRSSRTVEGFQLKKEAQRIIKRHHAAQKLLQSYPIVIPYADKLSFPADSPSSRRENQKFLTLIEAVTLLHQYQRKKFTKDNIAYIKSTLQDYRITHRLYKKAYRNNLVFTHPVAQLLLANINKISKTLFTRRDIVNTTGWPPYKVRDNIRYLEETGILKIIKKPKGRELIYKLDTNINLIEPEELEEKYSSTT